MAAAMGFDYFEKTKTALDFGMGETGEDEGTGRISPKPRRSCKQQGLVKGLVSQEEGTGDEGTSTTYMMTPEPSDSSVISDNTDMDQVEEEVEYDVESLVAIKYMRGYPYYLVKWKGYSEEENTWEPVRHLNCNVTLRRFHRHNHIPLPNQLKKRQRKEQAKKRSSPAAKRKQLSVRHKEELLSWQTHINIICTDPAPIYVLNDVDTEGPPANFIFVNEYQPDPDIVISDDPPLHCSCNDCFGQAKLCCAANNDAKFAYNRVQQLLLKPGQPIFECNKNCHCSKNCLNRVVQNGRSIPVCIFRTSTECGWGVKALADIREGTFVMEYVGEVITSEEAERRGRHYDANGRTYLFDLDFDNDDCAYTVDAAFYGNVSHFVNHSCDPNLQTHCVWIDNLDPLMPRIALFSKRFIQAGEELTFDYMMSAGNKDHSADVLKSPSGFTPRSHDDDPERKIIHCKCGAPECRKVLF